MCAVQVMCARLGMVSGRGLAGCIRARYPRWVLWGACALLIAANVVNIGADLAGMAEATELLTGIDSLVWTPLYAALIASLLIWSSYRMIARAFKWLTFALFAYLAAGILARPDWTAVLRATLIPHIEFTRPYISALVGILGTTISPYLFFWQAAQEVEEEKAKGRCTVAERQGATSKELRRSLRDVATGMFFSNLIMYFIILTTAATLHAHGQTTISTAKQAADALRPLAGNAAYWLFSLGLIGSGMLGIPVLAGSSAYAVSEAAHWRGSLDDDPALAREFYAVVTIAMFLGLALDYAGFDAVSMLYWSAVFNGILAPPLVVLVVLLTSRTDLMGEHVNGPWLKVAGWFCAGAMSLAAVSLAFAS